MYHGQGIAFIKYTAHAQSERQNTKRNERPTKKPNGNI